MGLLSESLKDRKAAILGSGRPPDIVSITNRVCGPEMRMTATPEGSLPLERAKIVSPKTWFCFISFNPRLHWALIDCRVAFEKGVAVSMFEKANLLGYESSPYLRQHAANPVHWRPWGKRALDEARETGKPILLSVGYAACHWCHVMAHECFEDAEVAALMNDLYVNVKVDREERPDIDQIYMAALGAMGQQGGWPLTMFLTPEAKPFWGGTYFPKHSKYGRPGFLDVLPSINSAWLQDRTRVEQNVRLITNHVSGRLNAQAESTPIDKDLFDQFAADVYSLIDLSKGGLSGAPKFPNAPFMDTLWLSLLRNGDIAHRDAFLTSLKTMLQGGIYDHLGGGLSRYSVDDNWLVPHFEKMLYDNAQLIRHATYAYGRTQDELLRNRIEETVGWLQREMLIDGRFASSLDADSEGEEGRFYVWEAAQIPDEPELQTFRQVYDVHEEGNWEGKTILNRLHALDSLDADVERQLAGARQRLFSIRENRVRPGRDDKALTDWKRSDDPRACGGCTRIRSTGLVATRRNSLSFHIRIDCGWAASTFGPR